MKKNQHRKLRRTLVFVVVCSVVVSFAQLFLKKGMNIIELSLSGLITNLPLILGVALYAVGAVLFIYALKHGNLSVVYPFISLSFVWVALLSLIFLGEVLVLLQGIGIFVIVVGVSFIGWGARND